MNETSINQNLTTKTTYPGEFNLLIATLAEMEWEFEVRRCDMINEDSPLATTIPKVKANLGKELRVLIYPYENTEIIVFDDEQTKINEAIHTLRNWS